MNALLFFGAILTGATERESWSLVYPAVAVVSGVALATHSYGRRNFALFGYGTMAVYLAVGSLVVNYGDSFYVALWWFLLSSSAVVAWLWKIQRRMKEPL